MPDIFLSYAKTDLPRVSPLVRALEKRGWSVWWDRTIPPGQRFARVIEAALDAAQCVVVVWSEESVASHWVETEAGEGLHRNVLVPVKIDDVRIPLEFRRIQAANLIGWDGAESHQEFERVVQAVADLLGEPLIRESAPQDGDELATTGVAETTTSRDEPVRDSLGMEFVQIPAGTFQMGSTEGYDNERPVHTVHITQPFSIGKYLVTQGQWEAVMEENPSGFTGELQRPVENVSWNDVQKFITRLNAQEQGVSYRLPTEAEWEYACRADSTTAYCFGDEAQQLGQYAWYDENAGGTTHPVGQLQPNAWGLYDMHGNVWEWVQDWYSEYSAAAVTDSAGPAAGSRRVLRGGGWSNSARGCRSAYRRLDHPGDRDHDLGLRLVRTSS